MARNPHEIVTLDDQEACPCGCGRSGYIEPGYISPFCSNCKHPESWHAEGTGPCEYPGSNGTEGCGCTTFDRESPQPTHIDIDYGTGKPKPMRIRYMELPGEINPNTNELTTPFVIVIDRAGDAYDTFDASAALEMAKQCGARTVFMFKGEVQIGDDPE